MSTLPCVRARQAYDDGRWRKLAAGARERCLRRLADLFEAHRELLTDLDVLEGGVLRGYSGFMVQLAIDIVELLRRLAHQNARLDAGHAHLISSCNRYANRSVSSASSCRGTGLRPCRWGRWCRRWHAATRVVLKPSEETPLTAVLLARLCIEAGIPRGVFNVVQGVGEVVGAALVEHPQVDAISFTGSVETGRRIQAAAAAPIEACGIGTRRQEPATRLRRRRSRCRSGYLRGGGVGSLRPGMHCRHTRAGANARFTTNSCSAW